MHASILDTLHEQAGARLTPPGAPHRLLTYGDVPAEYRAAREGCALFDQTDRGLVHVEGEEAAAFLHRMLANHVLTLEPGRGDRNLLLSPKGKVRFDFDLEREGDAFRLSTPPGDGAPLAEALEAYHFTEKLEVADASASHAPLVVLGPRAAEVVERVLGAAPPADDRAWVEVAHDGAQVRVTRLAQYGSAALRLDAGPDGAERLWSALREAGATPAGRIAADCLRVEACSALPHEDVDDNVYPQEARLEDAFALDKGCYSGQEVVAKIDTYGGLNKCLTALRVEHDDPVPRGAKLHRQDEEGGEWRELGLVTSWAYSFELDTGLVLAYVKRRHHAPGTRFRVGDGPARAEIVPVPVRADALPVTGGLE